MPKRESCGSLLRCRLPPFDPLLGFPPCTHARRLGLPLRPRSRASVTCNLHSARCPARAKLPATSCLGAFWTPADGVRGPSRHCRRPKTYTVADIRSRTTVRINCGDSGRVIRMAGLEPGDFFGEMTLIEMQTRSAAVVAESPTVLYELTAGQLYTYYKADIYA
jgi:hypothetical protein